VTEFNRLLVPVDASELAERALDAALTVASRFGSEIVLLWVRPERAPLQAGAAEPVLDEVESEVAALMNQARKRIARLDSGFTVSMDRVRAEVRAGAPVDAIVACAEENLVDMIVMGTHGRSGLTEMFTGSTTERVAARTSASLMAVKPEGFPYLRD
jgi:nucleotide-binding universal stress UspA family protein